MDADATTGGTRLRHGAFRIRARSNSNYNSASYGWTKFIGNLERVVGGLI